METLSQLPDFISMCPMTSSNTSAFYVPLCFRHGPSMRTHILCMYPLWPPTFQDIW